MSYFGFRSRFVQSVKHPFSGPHPLVLLHTAKGNLFLHFIWRFLLWFSFSPILSIYTALLVPLAWMSRNAIKKWNRGRGEWRFHLCSSVIKGRIFLGRRIELKRRCIGLVYRAAFAASREKRCKNETRERFGQPCSSVFHFNLGTEVNKV